MEEKNVKLVSIEEIVPNRFQPRQIFGEKELNELADSIKEHGIIQPLILRPLGDKYEIIAGERRYKAASIAGLYNVPAIIIEKNDNESAEIAIVENIQRKDLSPIEEAKSYQKLLNKGLTQEELAKKLGIAQPTVANKLRLLGLPNEVQDALLNNKISERHARALLKLENINDQLFLLDRTINEKLTVRQLEEEINKLLGIIPVQETINTKENEEIEMFDVIDENSVSNNFDSNNEITIEPFEAKKEEITENLEEIYPSMDEIFEEQHSEEKFEVPEIQIIDNDDNNDNNYLDTINKVREFSEDLISKGCKIKREEYDMDNEYQIIIKIEK